MKEPITQAEWTLLSAYLDGELNMRDKARVEEWLQTRSEVQQAYHSIQDTRRVLRSAPLHKAPRNFTLTPEMAPQRRRSFWLVPALRFSSALAAILSMILFFNPFAPSVQMLPMAAAEVPQEEMALSAMSSEENAMDTSLQAAESEPPAVIYWGTPPEPAADGVGGAEVGGMGNGGGGGGSDGIPMVTAEPPAIKRAYATETPSGEPSADRAAESQTMQMETTTSASGPILGIQSEMDASAAAAEPTQSETAQPLSAQTWYAVGLLALAAAALITSIILARIVRP